MKALVKAKAEEGLWLQEVDKPVIGPDDVLIRVHNTAICGTDVHIYNWDSWAQKNVPVPMEVLMLGYMNAKALDETQEKGLVTFWSRSKERLWTKGETSGNTLALVSVATDCDADAILVRARPAGPTCHTGSHTCFGEAPGPDIGFLGELQHIIDSRADDAPKDSYTAKLLSKGVIKCAQKVGEEGVETALAAAAEDDEALLGEAADLIFHLMVTLKARGLSLADVVEVLGQRHAARP